MEIKENTLYFLYRRGEPNHIKALYEKGEICINPIDFIRICDNNAERSDLDDGIYQRSYFGDAKITTCEYGLDFDESGTTLDARECVMTTDSAEKGNIYCLSGIYTKHLIGDRNNLDFNTNTFGESLILIINPRIFIKRILKALKKNGFNNIAYKPVVYYSNEYSGDVGIFRKHEKFCHQNEFRFFIPNKLDKPIRIFIGSLKDIARIENNSLIRLTYTDKKVQLIKIG